MASYASAGQKALDSNQYTEAIDYYTKAIQISSESPDYYIKRSTAHQRKSPPDYEAALTDAEIGVVAATKRAKRELIQASQFRRAIALYGLKRYADSKFLFDIVEQMNPKDAQINVWKARAEEKLKLVEDTKVTVSKIPDVELPILKTIEKPVSSQAQSIKSNEKALDQTPPKKIRHEWYQNQTSVNITLLAKGVPKDKYNFGLKKQALNFSFVTLTETTFDFTLEPLFAAIDPESSSCNITPSKVEFILKKAEPGKKWAKLESDQAIVTDNSDSTVDPKTNEIKEALLKSSIQSTESKPSYPTSSKSGPKNWDKLADDELAGDENKGDVNNFFQTLYKDAPDDVKRAMIKSYQESNGTVLSTDWSQVKEGKVETSPPDGMEAKNW